MSKHFLRLMIWIGVTLAVIAVPIGLFPKPDWSFLTIIEIPMCFIALPGLISLYRLT